VYINSGSPVLNNVPVWNCHAEARGGGFYLIGTGDVSVVDYSLGAGTNGTVLLNSARLEGGGFFISEITATLAGLRIYWNTATGSPTPRGGGVYVGSDTNPVTLLLNDIRHNSSQDGGGIYAWAADQLGLGLNHIYSNTASNDGGGAVFNQSAGLILSNWYIANATQSLGTGGGANVSNSGTDLVLRGNWFERNSAHVGGGLSLDSGSTPGIDANIFVSNTSTALGGAIYTSSSGPGSITNNIIARNVSGNNTAGGLAIIESPLHLINNTIADNTGSGIYLYEAEGVAAVNNIVAGNSRYGIENSSASTSSYAADYNDLYFNGIGDYGYISAGAHDLSINPQFVGSGGIAAYYHLQQSSPVSVTGSMDWAPTYDFDGDLRIANGTVAMGADDLPGDEYYVYLPLTARGYP